MSILFLALGLLAYAYLEIRHRRRPPLPLLDAIRARSRDPMAIVVIASVRSGHEGGMMGGPSNQEILMSSTPRAAMASGLVHNRTDDRVKRALAQKGEQGVSTASLAEELNLSTTTLDTTLLRLRGAGEAEPVEDERWRARS